MECDFTGSWCCHEPESAVKPFWLGILKTTLFFSSSRCDVLLWPDGAFKQNGLFDSLLRFSMSNVVSSLDASLASHDWLVLRVIFRLTELGTPPSPIFNRGVGAFEIRWLATNAWTEGSGIPVEPTID